MQQATVKRLPLSEAQTKLGAVIERARQKKEYFVIEKDGVPAAGLMDIDEFEDYLELKNPRVREIIKKGYNEYLAGKSHPAEELLDEIKKGNVAKPKRRRKK